MPMHRREGASNTYMASAYSVDIYMYMEGAIYPHMVRDPTQFKVLMHAAPRSLSLSHMAYHGSYDMLRLLYFRHFDITPEMTIYDMTWHIYIS